MHMLACCGAQNSKGESIYQLLESKDGVGVGFLTGTQNCRGDGWLSAGNHHCDMKAARGSRAELILCSLADLQAPCLPTSPAAVACPSAFRVREQASW